MSADSALTGFGKEVKEQYGLYGADQFVFEEEFIEAFRINLNQKKIEP